MRCSSAPGSFRGSFSRRLRLFAPHLAGLLLVGVLACSRGGGGSAATEDRPEANFAEQVDPEQNLTFTFPADMVPDSAIGRWDSASLVQLTPAAPGQMRWTDGRTLTFSPARPLAPATDYQLTLRNPGASSSQAGTYTFHTPYLALENSQAYWAATPGVAGAAEARVVLHFNYPVQPADVSRYLTLEAAGGGRAVPYQLGAPGPATTLTLAVPALPGAADAADAVPLKISLAAGLKPAGGGQATTQPYQGAVAVPARTALLITEMAGAYADGQGLLNVFTTQPVLTDDLPALLTLEPAVPFTVQALPNGFQVVGDFKAGQTYNVRVGGQLKGLFSTTLGTDYQQAVSFGKEPGRVAFADAGRVYLGAQGARNLALTVSGGVQRVQVSVVKVYEANVQNFLKSGQQYGYADSDESREGQEWEDHSFRYYDTRAVGDLLLARTVDVKSLPRDGDHRLLHLSLTDLEYDKPLKGLYVVRVQDTERRWLQDSRLVVVSDIGLVARQSRGGLLVFAASVLTAEPLAGVAVAAYSTNNQVVGRAITGADGTALLTASALGAGLGGVRPPAEAAAQNAAGAPRRFDEEGFEGDYYDNPAGQGQLLTLPRNGRFELGLVTARQGADFSLLDLSRTRIDVARYDIGGLEANAARYLAFTYGDRDLYRPGDTIRANTLVRDPDTWAPVTRVPLKARLVLPSGRPYQTQRLTLDAQGAAPATFFLPPSVMTGRWSLEILTGNDVLLASRKLSVEEFLPDRLRVKVDVARPTIQPGEAQQVQLQATTLFGPPAANRHYELEVTLRRTAFEPKGYDNFSFALTNADAATQQLTLTVQQGTTDEAGRATHTFTLPVARDMGMVRGTAFAAVFDETGRPVNRLADFRMPTQATFFGLGRFDTWVGLNTPLQVPVVAVDADGKPAAGTLAEILVVRRVWETVVERQYGRFAYNSQPREQVVYRRQLRTDAAGRATLAYTPLNSGDYEIRVRRPDGPTWVAAPFYAYGYGTTTANAFAVNAEGRVEISTDKPRYRVGEKAKLLLKTPFAGRLFVTVERDRVLRHFTLTTDARSATVEVPLDEASRPNVFVTVTAIRAQKPGGPVMPLTVARGYQPLLVEAPDAKLPVVVKVAEKTRARTVLPVRVLTRPGARLTVAVVDEGILQLKDFQTPDPHAYFYQRRALEVLGYDLYPFLFPEHTLGPVGARVGGDAYSLARRVNPFTSKRVRLVSLWSGTLQANAKGEATFQARIPQFSGAVRVMVVAWQGAAFGSAEKEVKVADPVVISAALPRFLSPLDTIQVPVTLTNTTGRSTSATATLVVRGPLRVVGAATATTALAPNAEAQVRFRVVAPAGVGVGTAELTVQALGETFRDRTELSIRPPAGLTSVAESGTIKGGQARTLDFGASGWLAGTLQARLTVARTPLARFADDLRYLIQYPYGCLEQTVSAAFPQLYYADLARALGQSDQATRYNPAWHVQEAIRKLEAMQQPNGALSYWPGGTETNWWASAYAAHFLSEAQRAGFAVDRPMYDRLLRFLSAQLRDRPTASMWVYDAQNQRRQRTLAKREALYSLYVLALNQRADPSALNYYKANLPLLSFESRYLLAAALAVSGNAPAARQVVPAAFAPTAQAVARNLSEDFSSPVRDEALGLLALFDVSPDHPTVPLLARRLSQQLGAGRWLSTQERAFALLALGRQARRDAASSVTATLTAGARSLTRFAGQPLTLSQGLAGQKVSVQTAGQGTLYYTQELEGVPTTDRAVPLTDENLLVRRQYLTRDGSVLPADHVFRQGELVVVRLMLQSPATVASVPNVALTDLLPAGLEVENPRLGVQRELAWLPENPVEPDYLDIRDDRLTYFTTATSEVKVFHYLARAVTAGTYRAAPVTAAAMYDATYRSASGGGVVRVTR